MMAGSKPSSPRNPKEMFGILKAYFSVIPVRVMVALGVAMLEGALKYGRFNWRTVGVNASTYYDAASRHLTWWWAGQDIDPDSGEHHLVKAMACLTVVLDSMYEGNLNDDRPPPDQGIDEWTKGVNAKIAALIAKYPDPKAPLTRASQTFAEKYEEIKAKDAEERSSRGLPNIGLGR